MKLDMVMNVYFDRALKKEEFYWNERENSRVFMRIRFEAVRYVLVLIFSRCFENSFTGVEMGAKFCS
jgi:hypothetical protein